MTWKDVHLPTTAVYEQLVDEMGCTDCAMRQRHLADLLGQLCHPILACCLLSLEKI